MQAATAEEKPAPARAGSPAVQAALARGQRWAASLPADSHVVRHGEFDSLASAERFIQQHDYLANARVLRAGSGPALAVYTGPFQTEARARAYVQRLGLKNAVVLARSELPRTAP